MFNRKIIAIAGIVALSASAIPQMASAATLTMPRITQATGSCDTAGACSLDLAGTGLDSVTQLIVADGDAGQFTAPVTVTPSSGAISTTFTSTETCTAGDVENRLVILQMVTTVTTKKGNLVVTHEIGSALVTFQCETPV